MSIETLQRLIELEKRVSRIETFDALPIVARYMTDTAQSLPSASWSIVNLDTQDFDPHSLVTTGASWKFTAPIGGYYQVNAYITAVSAGVISSGKAFYLAIYINGVWNSYIGHWHQLATSPSIQDVHCNGTDLVHLDKDDYLDLRFYNDLASAMTLETAEEENHISVHLVDRSL